MNLNRTIILTSATLIFAFAVNANEAESHEKKVTSKATIKAVCSSYNIMAESGEKTDKPDIIMLAMMKKCKSLKPEKEDDIESSHFDSNTNISDEHSDDEASNHSQESGMKYNEDMKSTSKQIEETEKDRDHHNQ